MFYLCYKNTYKPEWIFNTQLDALKKLAFILHRRLLFYGEDYYGTIAKKLLNNTNSEAWMIKKVFEDIANYAVYNDEEGTIFYPTADMRMLYDIYQKCLAAGDWSQPYQKRWKKRKRAYEEKSFRCAPVPRSSRARYRVQRNVFRKVHMGRKLMSQITSPEYREYTGAKDRSRMSLYSSWDYIYRGGCTPKNWKSRTKHRKQWAVHYKHKPKYTKTGRDYKEVW